MRQRPTETREEFNARVRAAYHAVSIEQKKRRSASWSKWHYANRDKKIAYNHKWYMENRGYWRKRKQAEPAFRMMSYLRTRIGNAIRRSINGSITKPSTTELLGCDMATLRNHLQSKFRDGMSWENYGNTWHIDHIIPCASFDLAIPEEQMRCFNFNNLQPLLALENRQKGKKIYAN